MNPIAPAISPTTVVPNAIIKLFASVSMSPALSPSSAGPIGISVPISPNIGPTRATNLERSSFLVISKLMSCSNFSSLTSSIPLSKRSRYRKATRYKNSRTNEFEQLCPSTPNAPSGSLCSSFSLALAALSSILLRSRWRLRHSNRNPPSSTRLPVIRMIRMIITG